jgi:hypothetical protein
MIKLRRLRCSFCRKNDSEVSKLVAGPRVYICDKCVAVASRIMEGGSHDDSPPKVEPTIWRKFSARARRFFSGGEVRRMTSYTASI